MPPLQQEISEADPFGVYAPPRRPIAWVTWLIVGSTLAVFGLQLYSSHVHGEDVLGEDLAFSPAAWGEGRYWTLLTYAWAHATTLFGEPGLFWLHVVLNMIPLICLGPALEDFLGHTRFLGLYLGGAIASALAWAYFDQDPVSQGLIGASGAVFAVIAAAGTAAPRARVIVYVFFLVPIRMSMRVLAIAMCAFELVQLVFGWMSDVAHTAHLGGAVFGFVYVLVMWLTSPRLSSENW